MRIFFVLIFFLTASCSEPSLVRNKQAYTPPAGSIVLRVQVTNVEFTEWSPNCTNNDNDGCVPHSYWHKYHARVKEVVAGSWAGSEVEFTYLQHAKYLPEVTNDCYVILHPASHDISTRIGVPYVADKILSRYFKGQKASIKALRSGT